MKEKKQGKGKRREEKVRHNLNNNNQETSRDKTCKSICSKLLDARREPNPPPRPSDIPLRRSSAQTMNSFSGGSVYHRTEQQIGGAGRQGREGGREGGRVGKFEGALMWGGGGAETRD